MRGKKCSYKSFKIGLNSIVRKDSSVTDVIQLKVLEVNRIVYNTYSFIKAYCLYLETNNFDLPELNTNFINVCFKLFYTPKQKGSLSEKNEDLILEVRDYYTKHYDPEGHIEIPVCEHIGNFLKYEAVDMITNYENLIKTSFVDKVRKYIDRYFGLKLVSGDERKILNRKLEVVKRDILENTLKSGDEYSGFIQRLKTLFYGDRELEKGTVYYDVKCNPWMYLSPAIILGLNIFPLRRSLIPSYITLDSECLQRITGNNKKGMNKIPFEDTWNKYFSIHSLPQTKKYERSGYEFLMIKTDGKGVSILLHKELLSTEKEKTPISESYITGPEFLSTRDLYTSIVGIDPGKEDLIHCTDGEKRFRYSAVQRKRECCKRVHRQKLDRQREPVKSIEDELSHYRSTSSNYIEFMDYVSRKREVEHECRSVYQKEVFRSIRWRGHILRQKSESKMIRNFKNTFGGPTEAVIAIGDWEQKQQMKWKEPTLGKGIRDIFRKNGYKIYLVDEHKTSCTCYQCEGENKKFMWRECPRPWRKGNQSLVHGLLRCTTCNQYWNRDSNASLNICSLAKSSPERPVGLQRGKSYS